MQDSSEPKKIPFLGIIAHRGEPTRYPENSLAGYKAALNMAMLYPKIKMFIEVDVRITADQEPVCVALHDDTIDRTMKGRGRIDEMHYQDVARMELKAPNHAYASPPNFAALRRRLNSQAPLFEITPDDYRMPTITEIMDITRTANQYRAGLGSPVGICFDLKSAKVFKPLADNINRFANRYDAPSVPMVVLAIYPFIKEQELQQFKPMLNEQAGRCFYDRNVDEWVRRVQLKTVFGHGSFSALQSAFTAGSANSIFKWFTVGDHDPSNDFAEGMRFSGNFTMARDIKSIVSAAMRQNVVWVDDTLTALQVLTRLQECPALFFRHTDDHADQRYQDAVLQRVETIRFGKH